jgi:hypothetical protein
VHTDALRQETDDDMSVLRAAMLDSKTTRHRSEDANMSVDKEESRRTSIVRRC